MELCQQFPRLGHSDQYRPMLRRSHHASELQALLGVLTIFFYFGANHETSPNCRAPKRERRRLVPRPCARQKGAQGPAFMFQLSGSFLSNHPESHKARIFNVIAEARAIEARVSHMIPSSILIRGNSHQRNWFQNIFGTF
jgi:hypothetical protein